jgi:hypothetical protein
VSHPSPRTAAPPCLPLDIKDLLKEDDRLLGFLTGKAFWMQEAFRREDCWREIAERGKMNCWLKGGLLKGNC